MKISQREIVTFSRQFATMISSGLSLIKTLSALEKQSRNPLFKKVINDIMLDIEGGAALSDAMAKHPSVFSDFFVSLVRAGETAGALSEVLERIANHLEKQDDLRRMVRGAFAYPSIIGALALLVVTFLVIVIVPVFKNVYLRMHLTLPLPTVLLIGISDLARGFWWLLLPFAAAAAFLYKTQAKNQLLKARLDRFKIKIPFFGALILKATAARFVRTLGDMISSGVLILEAIKVADKVAANSAVSEITARMDDAVRRGEPISVPLQQQNVFPAMVVQMIAAGEESGKLGFMLHKAADGLGRDVDDTVKGLVVKIEPLLTFLLACLVGFIAVAIYLPMFDVIKQMGS